MVRTAHARSYANRRAGCRDQGFSMVELMVAVTISMFTILIVAQTYAAFEGQKRTTTGGGSAQENGLFSSHFLETDLRMAGYGLVNPNGIACTNANYFNNGVASAAALMPVQILDGGGGSDTISITYSSSPAGAVPEGLTSAASTSSSTITVQAPAAGAFNVNDQIVLAVPGSGQPCTLLQVAAVAVSSGNLAITPVVPPGSPNIFPLGGYGLAPQAYVFNMGQMVSNQYQVMCNSLTVTNPFTAAGPATCTGANNFTNAQPVAGGIVNIQAQYGIAAVASQSVSCWVNATNGGNPCDPGNWANPSVTDAARIKAVRIAVVARSSQQEKTNVTGQCVNASATINNGPCAWPDTTANPAPKVDLSANPQWQSYRYKVYETIIPLRNILWANL